MRQLFALVCAAAVVAVCVNRYMELWTTGRKAYVFVSVILWLVLGGACVRIYKYEQ